LKIQLAPLEHSILLESGTVLFHWQLNSLSEVLAKGLQMVLPAMTALPALERIFAKVDNVLEAILSCALLWINVTTLVLVLQQLESAVILTKPMVLHATTAMLALKQTLVKLEFVLDLTL